ncbi:membrane-spanning 4-domains subfamily A member 6B [Phodopus roborovskii]|uniref:Ms4a6bl protein n=1 Tax=Phodopus roborovskii TaxID=109678 RepID=A0AAU9ZLZ8_PHORO|nr:membrane-spanning 4-domains subfamily A member 6B [Phodopus roborovskii]XP_051049923.1 membrane-spanning 4-domains subfamily A member 6B [Phodopus roborovskii]CAH6793776.1 Ms4a6bl [Phodopus roborovskii]
MIPQVVTNETDTEFSTNEVNFPQADKPQPAHQKQGSLKKYLKAEIKVIAAIQIMCGVMMLCLGIILASAPNIPYFTQALSVLLKSGYPFIGSLFFIISGILSVITETKSKKSLVDGSLTMNILSISFAFMGIIILSVSLASLHHALEECEKNWALKPTEVSYFRYHFSLQRSSCSDSKAVLNGMLSLMLICTVLDLGLAMIAAIVWWNQGNFDFSGNVIFMSHNSNNESSMESKSLCNPAYAEQN